MTYQAEVAKEYLRNAFHSGALRGNTTSKYDTYGNALARAKEALSMWAF